MLQRIATKLLDIYLDMCTKNNCMREYNIDYRLLSSKAVSVSLTLWAHGTVATMSSHLFMV